MKELIKRLQEAGLPIIILKDPLSLQPSITFTFAVVSFILCCFTPEKYIELFLICAGTYLGRKITRKD